MKISKIIPYLLAVGAVVPSAFAANTFDMKPVETDIAAWAAANSGTMLLAVCAVGLIVLGIRFAKKMFG